MGPISPIQECHNPLFETIIAAAGDDPNDDHAVEDQFLHIAKDVAMAESITKLLHEEIERILSAFGAASNNEDNAASDKEIEAIFREAAAVRLAANDAIRRHPGRTSKAAEIEPPAGRAPEPE